MFPLHSSADHAFVINRGAYHGKKGAGAAGSPDAATYSFRGSVDEGVSWESVKLIKHFDKAEIQRCPICLDDSFKCARITKCGHSFCLPCIIRHIHSSADQGKGVKCPCCASTNLFLTDCRPVEFVTITPPRTDAAQPPQSSGINKNNNKKNQKNSATTMRFVKLHRYKGSASPFLPRISEPRRAAPHALPLQTDHDAPFSRLNYVDPSYIKEVLTTNLTELRSMPREDDVFEICRTMAIEFVENELKTVLQEAPMEIEMLQRFANPSAGVYQSHHPQFIVEQTPSTLEPMSSHDDITSSSDANLIFSIDEEQEGTAHSFGNPQSQSAPIQRPRSSSVNSENSGSGRHRSCSIGSETSHDSNVSNEPGSPKQQKKSSRQQNKAWNPGSIYLGSDESLFYQSEDGQLCFLCGFNMQCLKTEFSPANPNLAPEEHAQAQAHAQHQQKQQSKPSRRQEPLPDVIQGRVMEVEHVTITKQNRQRMRFLSHLPVGTSITLVEIGLGGVLSNSTKKAFSKEFQKRRNARERKTKAEKRADERAQKREERRIEQVRAQVPLVNRNFRSEAIDVNSDDFGPSLLASSPRTTRNTTTTTTTTTGNPSAPEAAAASSQRPNARPAPTQSSFSSIARKASQNNRQKGFGTDDFPALGSSSAFPALGSSPPSTRKPPPKKWNVAASKLAPSTSSAPTAKKGKKPVLISTLTELGHGS